MTGCGAKIAGCGLNQPIGDEELAVLTLPQMKMREFMTDHRFELVRGQEREHRAGKNDMAFTRNVVQGGVGDEIVLPPGKG